MDFSQNKIIKVKFVDFWSNQNNIDSEFYKILSKKFNIEFSDKPDYLFFSVFGYEHLKYDCIRIFYTGEQVSPDFDIVDYAIGFDNIIFNDRYVRFPLFALKYSPSELRNIETRYNELSLDEFIKRDFCSFVYSNAKPTSPRDLFFDKLNQELKVSSGGRHLNNINKIIHDKKMFESKFRFSIAFENTSYKGYITEKLIDSYAASTIPIYYGDLDVEKDIIPDSFINLHRFDTFESAIKYILDLNEDPQLMIRILQKKKFKDHVFHYENDLLMFLENVFFQEYSNAFRRPNSSWAIAKVRRLRFISAAVKIRIFLFRFVIKIKEFFRKTFRSRK
jgi:alpha(1,3/1,4) fucosyltransferase